MEAVGYAEILGGHDPVISADAKKAKSRQNAEAAKERHRPVQQLKSEFRDFYERRKGEFPSRSEAARRFYKDLPHEQKRLLSPQNAVRTLTEALRR